MDNCYFFFRNLFKFYFTLWNRLEVDGAGNVPPEGGLLVVANHTSYLDPPLLGAVMKRRMTFLAKRELFTMPVIGRFVSSFSSPVDREKTSPSVIKDTVKRLCKGEAVAIFPAGQRALESDGTENFRRGLELLARLSKAVILPVYLDGPARSLPVGAKLPKPVKIKVRFGRPLRYGEDYSWENAAEAALRELKRLKR